LNHVYGRLHVEVELAVNKPRVFVSKHKTTLHSFAWPWPWHTYYYDFCPCRVGTGTDPKSKSKVWSAIAQQTIDENNLLSFAFKLESPHVVRNSGILIDLYTYLVVSVHGTVTVLYKILTCCIKILWSDYSVFPTIRLNIFPHWANWVCKS